MTKKIENLTVVMPVYKKDDPYCFLEAYDSIINQTILPIETIIVVDGPVGQDLENTIQRVAKDKSVRCFWLSRNVGRGMARHRGIIESTSSIIALMDSDDISDNRRFERQFSALAENDCDFVGGYILEFSKNITDGGLIRSVPLTHSEILNKGRIMQPVNNVTSMFKKDAYVRSGGYRDFKLIEDYDLFINLIYTGSKFINIPEVLVYVRVDDDQYARRGGFKYFVEECKVQAHMYSKGYISTFVLLRNIAIRVVFRSMPGYLLKRITRRFLRKDGY